MPLHELAEPGVGHRKGVPFLGPRSTTNIDFDTVLRILFKAFRSDKHLLLHVAV